MDIKEITVQELKQLQDSGADYKLIDVRNLQEYELCSIGGELIPMPDIPDRYEDIPRGVQVIVHCHHGGRSKKVIKWLQDSYGYDNLYNLTGGIHAWSLEIDTAVEIY